MRAVLRGRVVGGAVSVDPARIRVGQIDIKPFIRVAACPEVRRPIVGLWLLVCEVADLDIPNVKQHAARVFHPVIEAAVVDIAVGWRVAGRSDPVKAQVYAAP